MSWISTCSLVFLITFSGIYSPLLISLPVHDTSTQTNPLADAEVAGSITSVALRDVRNILRLSYNETITQLNVTKHIDYVMRAEGSDSFLAYPTILMAEDEWTLPYGHTNDDEEHIVDPIHEPVMVVRAGARYNDQCVSASRTFLSQTATQEMRDAYQTILDTQELVIGAMMPGINTSTLNDIMRTGLAVYTNRSDVIYSSFVGYGLSNFPLDDPLLSDENGAFVVEEGLILVVRIYLYFEAGWLVRVGDSLVITESGPEVLTNIPKALSEVTILSNATTVSGDISAYNCAYGQEALINATILDSANRSIQSIKFFDGKNWVGMTGLGNNTFEKRFVIDYSYPSFIPGLVRVSFADELVYLHQELSVAANATYSVELEPEVLVVVENDDSDTVFSWVFSRPGAEMIRIHFSTLHTPPGDQFLICDADGNIVYEFKWNLRPEATTPWVPGNLLYIKVQPQWKSVYGGVNHFYFRVDEIGVIDTEYVPPPDPTTTPNTPTTTTSDPITSPTQPTTPMFIDPIWILLSGLSCAIFGLVAFFIKRR